MCYASNAMNKVLSQTCCHPQSIGQVLKPPFSDEET